MFQVVESFFLWQTFDAFEENWHIPVFNLTLNSQIQKKFPIHPEAHRKFCKKIVAKLEELGTEEILEEFYLGCVQPLEQDKNYFKSYFQREKYLCSLMETREFVSQGTTGLKTWPGANFLWEYLSNHPELTRFLK